MPRELSEELLNELKRKLQNEFPKTFPKGWTKKFPKEFQKKSADSKLPKESSSIFLSIPFYPANSTLFNATLFNSYTVYSTFVELKCIQSDDYHPSLCFNVFLMIP